MSWYFEADRAAQAAAHFFTQGSEDRMQYLKLLKLLYWADRKSIAEKGFPITGDSALATDYGPVLSRVYGFIRGEPVKGAHVWHQYFRTDGFDIRRIANPGTDALSSYEERILAAIWSEHKSLDGFDTSHLSDDFPEWKEVYQEGSPAPIPLDCLLMALGLDEAERSRTATFRDEEQRYFAGVQALKREPSYSAR